MNTIDRLPAASGIILRTTWRVLGSTEWARAVNDNYDRVWLLTSAICDALHAAGIEGIPSASRLETHLVEERRDISIVTGFTGKNYAELASRHQVSTRTVRRIIERERDRRRTGQS